MKIEDLLSQITYTKFTGNREADVHTVITASKENKDPLALMWVSPKNSGLVNEISQGTVIIPADANTPENSACNYIFSENPRQLFARVLDVLYPDDTTASIADSAKIATTSTIGQGVSIGHHVVIEDHCTIGDHTRIDHNTVIRKGTIIGSNCFIGANCTVGGNGFGYEKGTDGNNEFIKHIGNVVLEDHVEIGNNTCIDRAVLGSTILRSHVKVDNLVHIAHGVVIGENSLIIANSLIGGSTEIGKRVWVSPSVSILNKISIDDDALIGMGAVVLKPVGKGEVIIGNPGKPLKK